MPSPDGGVRVFLKTSEKRDMQPGASTITMEDVVALRAALLDVPLDVDAPVSAT